MDVRKTIPCLSEPRFIGSVLEFADDRVALLRRVTRECGDIGLFHVWGRPVVLLNKAEYAHAVFHERARDFDRALLPPTVRATVGEGLLGVCSRDGSHRRQRKLLQPIFQPRPITAYADIMLDYARRVEETWQDGQTISIQRELERIATGIAGEAFFGVDLQNEVRELGEIMVRLLGFFEKEIRWPLPLPLWMPTPHNRRMRREVRRLDQIICGIIQKRRENGAGRSDLLSLLLAARYEDGQPLSDQEVRDQATTIFLGGYEEMAVSLTWTWWLLATHPHIYDRLLKEVDDVLDGRSPTVADLDHLPYTLQVFKEAVRLYSPADIIYPRIALHDVELDGYHIRRGMRVIVSPHLLHRKPQYFPDPESFEPERFAAERERQIPRHAYIPFSSGQHTCIGKHFALLEAHLLLAALSQRVRFLLAEKRDIQPRGAVTLRPQNDIKMIVQRRAQPSKN